MTTKMPNVLYVTYDGVLEPLGKSQVLAYICKLSKTSNLALISFEKKKELSNLSDLADTRSRLQTAGIRWYPLRYHKKPSIPATLFDIFIGAIKIILVAMTMKVEIIHVRSYIPALMALPLRSLSKSKILFDIRGFWVDERLDAGVLKSGSLLYGGMKTIEKYLFSTSNYIVTLTNASVNEIKRLQNRTLNAPEISVITTCVDLALFTPKSLKKTTTFTLGYVGSVGPLYMIEELFECFILLQAKIKNSTLLIINRDNHNLLRNMANFYGLGGNQVEIISEVHNRIPHQIKKMDAAVAIFKPTFSRIAAAPTKLGEYLACGVPCLINRGCGDASDLVEKRKVGTVLEGYTTVDREESISKLVDLVADSDCFRRCVQAAEEVFSLTDGVQKYQEIYKKLSK